MKQIILPLLGTVAVILILGLIVKNPGKFIKNAPEQKEQNIVKINGVDIQIIVASTNTDRAKGLSNKASLGEKEGMFFVFDQKNIKPSFWMKDMLIPIDIIWIQANKIVQIDKNIQAPQKGTPDNKLTIYTPKVPMDYVLEVNSGFSDKYNLKVNDSVDLTSSSLDEATSK